MGGPSVGTEIIKTTCGLCEIACGIDVYVEDGRPVKVRGMSEHVIALPCLKGLQGVQYANSPGRVKYPLRKVNGALREVGWDEAVDYLAERLTEIKERHGPQALSVFMGSKHTLRDPIYYVRRFCDAYGTPNFATGASYCFYPKVVGNRLTFGHFAVPSLSGTKCVVLWGSNPKESSLPQNLAIHRARLQRAKLLVVDPRRTSMARTADVHAQLRPGTDSALALAVLNVVINERLYDQKFVAEWTIGFDRLVEHVQRYTPESTESITGVPAETTRAFARMYATTKPATILQGLSLDPCTNGIQAIRAVAILIAITGNFDLPGGNTYHPKHPVYGRLGLPLGLSPEVKGFSVDSYPVFHQVVSQIGPAWHEISNAPLLDAILTGEPYPIRALIVHAANPVLSWPNANRTREALSKLDFLAVIDPKLTETAELADLILPSANYLEQSGLSIYHPTLPLVTYHRQAVEPKWGNWPDWKIWFTLARRMGYGQYFPWDDVEEAYRELLDPAGISLEELKAEPRGVFSGSRMLVKRYRKEGFDTPSGKVEIYSQTLADHGYDPLPTYYEPAESPVSQPELAQAYPLVLTTGARYQPFVHSQLHDIPALRKIMPDPRAEIHPSQAAPLGIKDGDPVIIETLRGRVKMKARVTADVRPDTVVIPHGWPGEANANLLTDDSQRDPISGTPGYRSGLCRVHKEANAASGCAS